MHVLDHLSASEKAIATELMALALDGIQRVVHVAEQDGANGYAAAVAAVAKILETVGGYLSPGEAMLDPAEARDQIGVILGALARDDAAVDAAAHAKFAPPEPR